MKRRFFQSGSPGRLIGRFAIWFLLAVICFLLARAVWGLWQKNNLAQGNLEASAARLAELEAHQRDLADKLAKLKTERGVEEEIRTNFAVVKAGEKVIKIVPATPTTTPTTTPPKPWWKFW
ncbi:MAG: hypothetical protein COV08_01140 [Candidatus Vogelbacteria bacterium CG10_big_fil_rev_8_21_14_0_10_49_38]|uniref:Septum formation initiator n=1 Tax=Candidatus Vogelbacteria bacterium CG10_big_fil_rev_8_21_14_0_10_49_38 TaxID=1975043 RepID=A0A2H0RK78_9BACT|nr:MAG: hypothetical protein BK006_01160 [bacterium CG10_49_38]PIR46175.1 MAG: hypothetical protein COV08_01140 [Candidatus Vogelbacteria bacterium CG10_big_fil_rev_8_21_14_0_10_49_38]